MMDGEREDRLYVILGFELAPLFDSAFDTDTAARAILAAIPSRVSHEGNVGEITEAWRMTSEQLATIVNGPSNGEETQDDGHDGNDPEGQDTIDSTNAEPVGSHRQAKPRQ
jgi:hypothetical protein